MRSCHHAPLRRAFVSHAALLLSLCFTVACADSTDDESRGEGTADAAEPRTRAADPKSADEIVRDVRATFGVLAEPARYEGNPIVDAAHERTGLEVTIPASAKDALRVAHPAGDVTVAVELLGATDHGVAASASGHAVYAGGGPSGSDVLIAPGQNGVEDFVLFAKPGGGEIRYRITPTGVRSLRLVANTLELLDAAWLTEDPRSGPVCRGRVGRAPSQRASRSRAAPSTAICARRGAARSSRSTAPAASWSSATTRRSRIRP